MGVPARRVGGLQRPEQLARPPLVEGIRLVVDRRRHDAHQARFPAVPAQRRQVERPEHGGVVGGARELARHAHLDAVGLLAAHLERHAGLGLDRHEGLHEVELTGRQRVVGGAVGIQLRHVVGARVLGLQHQLEPALAQAEVRLDAVPAEVEVVVLAVVEVEVVDVADPHPVLDAVAELEAVGIRIDLLRAGRRGCGLRSGRASGEQHRRDGQSEDENLAVTALGHQDGVTRTRAVRYRARIEVSRTRGGCGLAVSCSAWPRCHVTRQEDPAMVVRSARSSFDDLPACRRLAHDSAR